MFDIKAREDVFRWYRIFLILSLDTFHLFENYLLLPISNKKINTFAKQVIHEFESLSEHEHKTAEMLWQSPEIMRNIYKSGEGVLGTKDMNSLAIWINNIPFENELEIIFSVWHDKLLLPIIELKANELNLDANTVQKVTPIIQKYSNRFDELETAFDTLEKQGLSEWDDHVKHLHHRLADYYKNITTFFWVSWVGNLTYAIQVMDLWREITQVLKSEDLQVFQNWMLKRSQNMDIQESKMNFEFVEQQMKTLFSVS